MLKARSAEELKGNVILDLCGGTGAWSKPYREAGYDVRLITLPEHDVLEYLPPHNVYGILAAPPCTMFSLARQNAKTPRDFVKGMETVRACMEIIWLCQQNGGLKFWALENPRGYLRRFLGVPHYSFSHWQFDPKNQHNKSTDIWGYFNEPKPIIKKFVSKPHKELEKSWSKPTAPEWTKNMKLDRAAIRAITPEGFAQAFFKANP